MDWQRTAAGQYAAQRAAQLNYQLSGGVPAQPTAQPIASQGYAQPYGGLQMNVANPATTATPAASAAGSTLQQQFLALQRLQFTPTAATAASAPSAPPSAAAASAAATLQQYQQLQQTLQLQQQLQQIAAATSRPSSGGSMQPAVAATTRPLQTGFYGQPAGMATAPAAPRVGGFAAPSSGGSYPRGGAVSAAMAPRQAVSGFSQAKRDFALRRGDSRIERRDDRRTDRYAAGPSSRRSPPRRTSKSRSRSPPISRNRQSPYREERRRETPSTSTSTPSDREEERRYETRLGWLGVATPASYVRGYLDVKRRYDRLAIAPDFAYLECNWVHSLPTNAPLPLHHPFQAVVDNESRQEVDPEPSPTIKPTSLRNVVWNVRVMLMASNPGPRSSLFKNIKFLVGRKGRNELVCVGTMYDPAIDGTPDPEDDRSVLVRAAIRAAREYAKVDLTGCTRWVEFATVHYRRPPIEAGGEHRPEVSVFYIPDVWNLAQKIPERGADSLPVLQITAKRERGTKLKAMMISLEGMLDYDENDKSEDTFEVSLFAELFYEMLQRDFGGVLVEHLLRAYEKSERDSAAFDAAYNPRKRKRDESDEAPAQSSSSASAAGILPPEKKQKLDTDEADVESPAAVSSVGEEGDTGSSSPKSGMSAQDVEMADAASDSTAASLPLSSESVSGATAQHNGANEGEQQQLGALEDGEDQEEEEEDEEVAVKAVEDDEAAAVQHPHSSSVVAGPSVSVPPADTPSLPPTTTNTAVAELAAAVAPTSPPAESSVNGAVVAPATTQPATTAQQAVNSPPEWFMTAFNFFDYNITGYLKARDLETIVHCVRNDLSHRHVQKAVASIADAANRVQAMRLYTPKQRDDPAQDIPLNLRDVKEEVKVEVNPEP